MMDHPNIAKVLDAGATESGRPYFVMELVRGVPITEYCDREPALDPPSGWSCSCWSARPCSTPTRRGSSTATSSPPTSWSRSIDGVPVPKVIDFGIAKATGAAASPTRRSSPASRQLVGTPLYMSPEQAELSGLDVDTRSDIYSPGRAALRAADRHDAVRPGDAPQGGLRRDAADHPRGGAAEAEHAARARWARRSRPSRPTARTDPRQLSRAVRGELDWIVMKALEKDRTPALRDGQRLRRRRDALPDRPSRWRRARRRRRYRFAQVRPPRTGGADDGGPGGGWP